MESAVFAVVMLAARFTSPVALNPPFAMMVPVAFFVSTPEFVTESAPVIFTAAFTFIAPQLLTVTVVSIRATPVPTVPPRVSTPVPAARASVSAAPAAVPSTVPLSVIDPAPAPLFNVTVAPCASTRLPPMESAVLAVVMFAARFTAPVVENPPGAIIVPVAFLVKMPELVTAMAPLAVSCPLIPKVVPRRVADPTVAVVLIVVVPVAGLVCVRAPAIFTMPRAWN
jgi:hypothetical protein